MLEENKSIAKELNTSEKEEDLTFKDFLKYIGSFFKDIVDLQKGVDKKATIKEIIDNRSMSGANAWMLMCSIMIASLGLDINSPAVIIGGMLISPLMSPILGMGLGVGINDKNAIRSSLTHFTIAILIAILTSTVYFLLSPLGILTSEIEARTEPTILDVLIAFFGGIAGIISYARKDISTTIPGVAIATALMPPLCVTGYGIANWDLDIMLSSFYLFFSNTFFISLATYFIVRLLEFPYRRYINKRDRRRNRFYVVLFSLLVIIPSFLILRGVLNDIKTDLKISEFIELEFGKDKKYLDQYLAIESDSINELVLKVYGSDINKNFEGRYEKILDSLGLKNWEVTILPTSEINLERISRIESQIDGVDIMVSQIDSLQSIKSTQAANIQLLKEELRSNMLDSTFFEEVCANSYEKFPELKSISIGVLPFKNFKDSTGILRDIVIIQWDEKTNPRNYGVLEEKLNFYLQGRLQKDSLQIIRY